MKAADPGAWPGFAGLTFRPRVANIGHRAAEDPGGRRDVQGWQMLKRIVFLSFLATAAAPAFADQIILPSALTRDRSVAITYRMGPPRTGRATLAIEWTDGDGRLIERRR